MDRVFEVELFDQLREVVRIGIHFVAIPWLVRSAVAATVMGDATISAGSQTTSGLQCVALSGQPW